MVKCFLLDRLENLLFFLTSEQRVVIVFGRRLFRLIIYRITTESFYETRLSGGRKKKNSEISIRASLISRQTTADGHRRVSAWKTRVANGRSPAVRKQSSRYVRAKFENFLRPDDPE